MHYDVCIVKSALSGRLVLDHADRQPAAWKRRWWSDPGQGDDPAGVWDCALWQTVQEHGWHWDCKQRTATVHTGVPMQRWLDLEKAGEHELLMSMREDGIEVDRIALTTDVNGGPDGSRDSATEGDF